MTGSRRWTPALGAWPEGDGFQFRVWAHGHASVELVIRDRENDRRIVLARDADGTYGTHVAGLAPGARYGYALDGDGPFPDPVSRAEPDGVHGLSALVDPRRFAWTDAAWRGLPLERAVFYELHVGTFTPEGTFAGVMERLSYLADLGITVVELMPIADFPGTRNWGYDGVSLFAPAHGYGTPDDLRRLVDAAHALGLAIVLDVVYNHFGPDGAYGFAYSPHYTTSHHHSPWGAAVNFDDAHARHVRDFVIENAQHWVHEYHIDGLRLDATHAIVDDTRPHVIAELTTAVRASVPDRTLLFVAEDDRNLPEIVRTAEAGGWGCDAVWADDFHHQARRIATGDRDAYFQDYSDDTRDLAETLRRGWFYSGQQSAFRGRPRGESPEGVAPARMVICLQNHDQVGNRAHGDRLNQRIDPALFRALTAVLITAPETPLLFMGEEWGASTPFQYFTDHTPDLGRLITEGRRNEFAAFEAFRDQAGRAAIPDPQAAGTFDASHLRWDERLEPQAAATLAFHRALLHLRQTDPALAATSECLVHAPDPHTIVLRRQASGRALLLVARFDAGGRVELGAEPWAAARDWSVRLTSEDAPFLTSGADDSTRPHMDTTSQGLVITFDGPAAVLLQTS